MLTREGLHLFPAGRLLATPGALAALKESGQRPADFLARHLSGDWGEVDEADAMANTQALGMGLRILSAYTTKQGEKLWVITEADRSTTTILVPSEY